MKKEEILAKSRKENRGGDERELREIQRAGNISYGLGGLFCFLLVLVKLLLNDSEAFDIVTYTCYGIYSAMGCCYYSLLYAKLKKPLYWIAIGGLGLLFAACMFLFVMELCC